MDNYKYRTELIKRVYRFSLDVIKFSRTKSPQDYASRVIFQQLIRSATSIGANIVEAQASPTRKDFANYINHALKSANESRYWIALLRDSAPGKKKESESLLEEAQQLSKILGSTIQSLKNPAKA